MKKHEVLRVCAEFSFIAFILFFTILMYSNATGDSTAAFYGYVTYPYLPYLFGASVILYVGSLKLKNKKQSQRKITHF